MSRNDIQRAGLYVCFVRGFLFGLAMIVHLPFLAGSPPTTRVMPVLTCWRPQLRAGEGGTSVGKLSLGKPSEGMGVKPATRLKSGMRPAWEGARPFWGQHTLGERPSNLGRARCKGVTLGEQCSWKQP